MKAPAFLILATALAGGVRQSIAATLLSQNFDTDPENYTHSLFAFQASDPTRYFGLSNAGMSLNPGVTGNTTVHLAGQNMDGDGDGTLTYSTGAPANVDFTVSAAGFTDLKLSIDLAGMPNVEPENYVRMFEDVDGDGFYESVIFNFLGGGNSPYTDITLGELSGEFKTFADVPLLSPTAADGMLRLRLEIFNDTQSQNEASGVDNIIISGTVPEPATGLTGLLALGALGLRRRR
jgi:MYXO-CTERM domain-containing protein